MGVFNGGFGFRFGGFGFKNTESKIPDFKNLESSTQGGSKLRIPKELLQEKLRTQIRFNVRHKFDTNSFQCTV
jgi:hypothetical protein